MRRPWSIVGLLASVVLLLVSLFMPWQQGDCSSGSSFGDNGSILRELNLFSSSCFTETGFGSPAGQAACVGLVLILVFVWLAWVRPDRLDVFPIGRAGLAVAYFAVTAFVVGREAAGRYGNAFPTHTAYGSVVALVAVAGLVVGVARLRRSELEPNGSRLPLVGIAAAIGLLISFLIPWFGSPGVTVIGADLPVTLPAAIAVCIPAAWWRRDDRAARREQLCLSVAAAALTLSAAVGPVFPGSVGPRAYGLWVAVGFALGLVLPAVVRMPLAGWRAPAPGALAGGCLSLVVFASLVMPWERICVNGGSVQCVNVSGWSYGGYTLEFAAGLALFLALLFTVGHTWAAETSAVQLVLVAVLGFNLVQNLGGREPERVSLGYGAIVGFCSVALVVLLACRRVRLRRGSPARAIALACCFLYVMIEALPWLEVLPRRIEDGGRFLGQGLPVSIVEIGLAVSLGGLWARGDAGKEAIDLRVVIPAAMLALLGCIFADRLTRSLAFDGGDAGGGLLALVCLVLILLAVAEQRGGLRKIPVPEVLRIDRI